MGDGGLLVAAPLWWEAWLLGGGLRTGRTGGGAAAVLRTGMGPRRSAAALPALRRHRPAALAVAGFGGALVDGIAPGDAVVATELRSAAGTVVCPGAAAVAETLRAAGLVARLGPVAGTDHVVHGAERAVLAATGALAVDMESAVLAAAADGGPLAVVRVVVDTPGRPLLSPATITGGLVAAATLRRVGAALRTWAAAVVEPSRAAPNDTAPNDTTPHDVTPDDTVFPTLPKEVRS